MLAPIRPTPTIPIGVDLSTAAPGRPACAVMMLLSSPREIRSPWRAFHRPPERSRFWGAAPRPPPPPAVAAPAALAGQADGRQSGVPARQVGQPGRQPVVAGKQVVAQDAEEDVVGVDRAL